MPALRLLKPPPSAPPDAELIESIRAGDRQAAEVLFRRHHAMVSGLAFRLLGGDADGELPAWLLRRQRVLRRSSDRHCMWIARNRVRVVWLGHLRWAGRLRGDSAGLLSGELRWVLSFECGDCNG